MIKQTFLYGFMAVAVLVTASACTLSSAGTQVPAPKPYEVYDQRVNELEAAVTAGEISVGQAELERQKAFRAYLSALGNENVANEYRNY